MGNNFNLILLFYGLAHLYTFGVFPLTFDPKSFKGIRESKLTKLFVVFLVVICPMFYTISLHVQGMFIVEDESMATYDKLPTTVFLIHAYVDLVIMELIFIRILRNSGKYRRFAEDLVVIHRRFHELERRMKINRKRMTSIEQPMRSFCSKVLYDHFGFITMFYFVLTKNGQFRGSAIFYGVIFQFPTHTIVTSSSLYYGGIGLLGFYFQKINELLAGHSFTVRGGDQLMDCFEMSDILLEISGIHQ